VALPLSLHFTSSARYLYASGEKQKNRADAGIRNPRKRVKPRTYVIAADPQPPRHLLTPLISRPNEITRRRAYELFAIAAVW